MPTSAQQLLAALLILALSLSFSVTSNAFERTEQRENCKDYSPLKRPLFGDTHVHTRYSFDSYISSQRNDPWDAYRYAKGEAIYLPNEQAEQILKAQI